VARADARGDAPAPIAMTERPLVFRSPANSSKLSP
jgi:hypothetical protein